ncbi:MAG: hypothetical protein KJP25_05970 [Gammaproteobacteria bacterium]|nr:hypothetical protein [Gammaproteobacteria bacterium]MBT8151000.1 hypothetical protein [Gammaproteobacteria bacterium]NND38294.1 hypothetical protein [Pseudomonadales bacterium]NNM11478.1 hypothetical protein [Pseudomonadales bacterium]RZV57086.1 MAG: hypothetical protein EX270_04175 [Pseudomonadales bacterium]
MSFRKPISLPDPNRKNRAASAALSVALGTIVFALAGCNANESPRALQSAAQPILTASDTAQAKTGDAASLAMDVDVAMDNSNDFLPVDEAFKISLAEEDDELVVIWSIAPDYYLYRHKFGLAWAPAGGQPLALDEGTKFSRGLGKTDDYFGHVEVFYHQALARIPRQLLVGEHGELEVKYQGCADAGLCYPVQSRTLAWQAK